MRDVSLSLVGFYLENGGRTVVLVDPKGGEHEAQSPEELWAAVMAIHADPALPRAACDPDDYAPSDGVAAVGSDIQNFAVEAVEGIVGDAAGPTFGRLAGAMVRNGGGDALRFLRRISRGGGNG